MRTITKHALVSASFVLVPVLDLRDAITRKGRKIKREYNTRFIELEEEIELKETLKV